MLRSVNIRNYKNYREEFIEFSERFALINGDIGSGKTNLIDSIYYICMCKSYFTEVMV
ncbi:MAG: AAA family ATPase [Bacteroidetes bacterium]|nr:AAA family ATPase [Bacteroidota bacterium]